VGGRFVEVYDQATGEGFEIGRVKVWEPGRRVAYSWRQADWRPGEEMEIEVTFEPPGPAPWSPSTSAAGSG
jgi:uncharacterized protein YndB with AHSA1/START domain